MSESVAPYVQTSNGSFRVLMVLPPDFVSPIPHRRHRFPHQGPALVAASVRPDGVDMKAVDLELELWERPLRVGHHVLDDDDRLRAHLAGHRDDDLVEFAREMIERIGDVDVDAFAISIDRHTQIKVSVLVGIELKRKFGKPVLIGGGNSLSAGEMLRDLRAKGVDLITMASTPHEIRDAFRVLREVPHNQWEIGREPMKTNIATPPDEWPIPDFTIYDLERYRRDPFLADGTKYFPKYDGSIGRRLFLPYYFAFDCQYACAFCQRGGKQSVKSVDRIVRDFAEMAEKYDCRDFMLFNAQTNLHADAVSKGLIAANLGIHWTDSFRVAPRRPADVLETMAKAGCVGLTFGVESASDRMLKKMIKGHNQAQATKIVRDAHALDIFVRVNLLPCFPGEKPEDHKATVDWVRENAFTMDDIAPSAFYLADGSPVGQYQEKFGIVIRGSRELHGDHKFRKNLGSLAYDEVDGYTWEEREALLRPAEEELRQAWRDGRKGIGASVSQPSQTFALRRDFRSKAEGYAKILQWIRIGQPLEAGETARLGRALAGMGDYSPDEPIHHKGLNGGGATLQINVKPVETLPADSLRAKAVDEIRKYALAEGVTTEAVPAGPARLTVELKKDKASLKIHVERGRNGAKFFKRGKRLMLWYASDKGGAAVDPVWMNRLLMKGAEILCSLPFDGIADELQFAQPAPEQPQRGSQGGGDPVGPVGSRPAAYRQWSVIDLVRDGLKPACSAVVPPGKDPFEGLDGIPAKTVSTFAFVRDAHDNLVFVANPKPGEGERMLYVGRAQADVERLRDIEELLYARRQSADRDDGINYAVLQDEFGRILGFPSCCTRKFSETYRAPTGHADLYTSLERLGWHLKPIDPRLNHIATHQYQLPYLIHVPCSASCRASYDLVEVLLSKLYQDGSRAIIEDVLSRGAVVWPDDRIVFFKPQGEAEPNGEWRVSEFNVDAHPDVMRRPRPPERTIAKDSGDGFRDADVTALRIRDGALEAYANGAWRRWPAKVAPRLDAPPLVILPKPGHGLGQAKAPLRASLNVVAAPATV